VKTKEQRIEGTKRKQRATWWDILISAPLNHIDN
jgi:hypothetical protein